MPIDRSAEIVPFRRICGALLIGGMVLTTAGCPVTPTPFSGRGGALKTEFAHEDPLELTGPVHELDPPLEAGVSEPRFSDRSRFYVWSDHARGMLKGAEIGGTVRELAPVQGRWLLDWTADGQKFLLTDLAISENGLAMVPYRAKLYSLAGGEPVAMGEFTDPRGTLLPDGSGLTYTRLVNEPQAGDPGLMPNLDLQNREPRRLMIRLPGQPEQEETVLNGPGLGLWSHDARYYAYVEHRDGDPVNGLDLRVYDRQAKTSALRYHIESDNLRKVIDGLSWSADNRLWLAQACQVQASGSIAVTSIPVDGKAIAVAVVPVSLEEGETIDSLRLSPNQAMVSFETLKTVTMTDGIGRVSGLRSTGIVVASLESGKVRRLTPRGRVVTWLPGGKDLIAATGYGLDPRYYRLDIPSAEEL